LTGQKAREMHVLLILTFDTSYPCYLHLYYCNVTIVPGDFQRAQGVRILTFFMYLNDVEEGGETDFPQLGITVKPKKGQALLWPNVYMRNPDARDGRTMHQALPVKKGVKYAANLWLHQRDFKTPFYNLCN
jgi:prolyl 4-hydroxylase